MPGTPLAYFFTFATYGSRLHGDARGTVDRHNRSLGEEFLRRDDFRRGFELRRMKGEAFEISASARAELERAFAGICQTSGWALLALNIRITHVHAVVAAEQPPTIVLHALKAFGTRALRSGGLVDANARIWARHGSTQYAWMEAEVEAVIEYTLNAQGADLPGSDRRNWSGNGAS